MKVQIMSPAADRVDFKVPPAPRLSSLEGKTIGLYNNMTGGADVAVDRVAEHLSQRYADVKFERYGGDLRPGRPALSRGVLISMPRRRPGSPWRWTPLSAPRPIEEDARRGLPMTWLPLRKRVFRPLASSPAALCGRGRPVWRAGGSPVRPFTIPHATTGQQAGFIRTMVDTQIDAAIRCLTALPAAAGTARGAQDGSKSTEIFTVEMDATPAGLGAVNRFLAERDWSDGLPVIPPTPAAVEQMLGDRRQPQDVLMVMEPGFGLASVEKIAINAVMAGCRRSTSPCSSRLLTAWLSPR